VEIVMYRSRVNEGLTHSEFDAARLGFIHYLRRKRFSPQFIESHADDLFATAMLEYSRKLAEGVEIEKPTGFLINCAWRRTKSLLEAQQRTPQVVPTDKSEAITDELTPSPEETVLDEDRCRKVQEAVDQLSVEERRLLELSYFEGLAVREAARRLRWHPSKAQRCHEAARDRLHALLGVTSIDELEIEIGLAAFLSLAAERSAGLHLPAGIEAVAEMATRGTASAWARAQELARRLPLGGGAEPSATAALSGTAGRAAGVCATAALACLASGVVGPGVGVDVLGGGDHHAKPPAKHHVAVVRHRAPLIPKGRPTPASVPKPEPAHAKTTARSSQEGSGSSATTSEQTEQATRAVRSQTIESAAGSEEVSSAPVESAPVTESSASSSSSSASPTQIANEQFGP
jgi:RNA polymerase sigma factor (sigma-70 family)